LAVLWGGWYLWAAFRTSPEVKVVLPPNDQPVPDRIRYYRRLLWVSAVVFPLAAAGAAYNLCLFDTGQAPMVRVIFPFTSLYHYFGYWPAVCFLPIIGVLCCSVFVRRLRKLSAAESSIQNPKPKI
jgi:hypothetical protein